MIDDLNNGYCLLFVDGGIRADGQGQKKGAIGAVLREPGYGEVLDTVKESVGPVGSPLEAEYHALIRGLKLAEKNGVRNLAVFSDSRTLVNQITRGWNKNERVTKLFERADKALKAFKAWQLSWVPREMNKDADELVDQAFKGERVTHATD